ncbi:MAG: hypothetical protein JW860_07920, partial [Sedimentisphaerales bacterium]|nr:hypothetical protein [Sedimentisphaerales bacterium]
GDQLSKINGKMVNLVGDIHLTGGLGQLNLNNILDNVSVTTDESVQDLKVKVNEIGSNVNFDLAGTLAGFQANSYTGGSLVADNIKTVKIKTGDLGADIMAMAGDIQSLSAAGDITGRIMADGINGSGGIVKKITSSAGNFTGVARASDTINSIQAINLDNAILSAGNTINKAVFKGDIVDSYILAGYDIGTDCALGLVEPGGADLPGGGSIGSVTAKGTFQASYLSAGTLPETPETLNASLSVGLPYASDSISQISKVKFSSLINTNNDMEFGISSATSIGKVQIGKLKLSDGYTDEDFTIAII